ncbi:hypothetical protein PR202_gb23506 [Eleusine coracana subsp. coracana]|uniref:Calmodulin-binding protein n=1 Tax=Eleusine coracana subsp. coracana TaxID=191504 RepID=A0AAV5FK43_ELECO|nr:hypothetical protein PR202_gb23506 [Eleusine coracana subsp. coracana]
MKRGHQQGAGGGEGGADGRGGCPPVLKKRCRSLDLTHIDQNRPPRYRLTFMNGLDSEVFTKKDIFGTNGELIKICVSVNDPQGVEETELHRRILSAKIKIVVLDGDFNKHNQECWTSEEFKNYIVLPRDNIGSVLTGVSELSLKNGEAFLCGVALNDNSKFVRCGKFRLGVMIDDNLGERVLEGITEPFIVKDRRGEGSKKHEIPLLNDDVWRMKKIAKDGVFHKALKSHDINYVQDFLRLYHKDEQALGKILINATKKVWTSIVEHAKKCDPGKELHSFIVQGENTILFFNSVCQIVGAAFGDNYTPFGILDMHKKDASFDFSLCLDPIFDQYCASTSENDITGLVTLHCAANMANEITGSVVLTQAPMTMDQQSYNILPFTGSASKTGTVIRQQQQWEQDQLCENKVWNEQLVCDCFISIDVEENLKVRPGVRLQEDVLAWAHEGRGHYSVRSAYLLLKEEQMQGEWQKVDGLSSSQSKGPALRGGLAGWRPKAPPHGMST